MDSYKWLYISRSRLNDQTGQQIEATFYGKNVAAKELYEMKLNIDKNNFECFDFGKDHYKLTKSLEFTLPETICGITYYKWEAKKKPWWVMSDNHEKDFSYF